MAKTGLVLEGGGMRGLYTAGVLDVFMEHGITFDGVIGVSAGAAHASSLLSNQKGRGLRYTKKYCTDWRFMSTKSFIKTGDVVGVDFCYNQLPNVLDPYDYDAFDKNTAEFYVTCTNVESGEAEYIKINDLRTEMNYLRASASLPFVSKTVEFGGRKLLDGGCTDSIPVEAFMKIGYENNVVILTRPEGFERKPENYLLTKLVYRKYPKFVNAMRYHHIRYNNTVKKIARLEKDGVAYVIRPSVDLDIGRLENDPEKVQRVYDIGRADALAQIDRLCAWLDTKR